MKPFPILPLFFPLLVSSKPENPITGTYYPKFTTCPGFEADFNTRTTKMFTQWLPHITTVRETVYAVTWTVVNVVESTSSAATAGAAGTTSSSSSSSSGGGGGGGGSLSSFSSSPSRSSSPSHSPWSAASSSTPTPSPLSPLNSLLARTSTPALSPATTPAPTAPDPALFSQIKSLWEISYNPNDEGRLESKTSAGKMSEIVMGRPEWKFSTLKTMMSPGSWWFPKAPSSAVVSASVAPAAAAAVNKRDVIEEAEKKEEANSTHILPFFPLTIRGGPRPQCFPRLKVSLKKAPPHGTFVYDEERPEPTLQSGL